MESTILNTRELSKETARVLERLSKTGPRIVTRGGKVAGILIPPSGLGIEEDLDLVSRLRLGQALDASQNEAVRKGADRIPMSEIDREIAEVRRRRKRR